MIMRNFIINALSAHNQCNTNEDVAEILLNIVDCLKIIAPGISSGMLTVIIDERIHGSAIFKGEALHAAFSSVNKKTSEIADAKRLWFLYTTKMKKANTDGAEIGVASHSCRDVFNISGEGSIDLLTDLTLISLGGSALMTQPKLKLSSAEKMRVADNVYDRHSIYCIIPIYEASDKHRMERYYDHARRETVAPMTFGADIAQEILSSAVLFNDDYFGVHERTGKIVRFKQTLNNIYHGFEVDESEIPNSLLNILGFN